MLKKLNLKMSLLFFGGLVNLFSLPLIAASCGVSAKSQIIKIIQELNERDMLVKDQYGEVGDKSLLLPSQVTSVSLTNAGMILVNEIIENNNEQENQELKDLVKTTITPNNNKGEVLVEFKDVNQVFHSITLTGYKRVVNSDKEIFTPFNDSETIFSFEAINKKWAISSVDVDKIEKIILLNQDTGKITSLTSGVSEELSPTQFNNFMFIVEYINLRRIDNQNNIGSGITNLELESFNPAMKERIIERSLNIWSNILYVEDIDGQSDILGLMQNSILSSFSGNYSPVSKAHNTNILSLIRKTLGLAEN